MHHYLISIILWIETCIYIIFIITKLRAEFLILYLYKKNEYREEVSEQYRGCFFGTGFTLLFYGKARGSSAFLSFARQRLPRDDETHTPAWCIAVLNGARWIDFSSATCVLSHNRPHTHTYRKVKAKANDKVRPSLAVRRVIRRRGAARRWRIRLPLYAHAQLRMHGTWCVDDSRVYVRFVKQKKGATFLHL